MLKDYKKCISCSCHSLMWVFLVKWLLLTHLEISAPSIFLVLPSSKFLEFSSLVDGWEKIEDHMWKVVVARPSCYWPQLSNMSTPSCKRSRETCSSCLWEEKELAVCPVDICLFLMFQRMLTSLPHPPPPK